MTLSSFGALSTAWRYIQYFIVMVIFVSLIILITYPYAVKDNRIFKAFNDEPRQDSGSIKLNVEHKDTLITHSNAVKDNRVFNLFNDKPSHDSGHIKLNREHKDTQFSAKHINEKLKAVKDNRLFNNEPSPVSGSINLNVENKDTLFSAQDTRKKLEIPVLHQYSSQNSSKRLSKNCRYQNVEIDPYEHGGPNDQLSTKKQTGEYPDCAELHFSTVLKLPLVRLATFPGSGNTWMRHLIQQLTGIYTGAVYKDGWLKSKGFHGEAIRNSSVVVIKTHKLWKNCTLARKPKKPRKRKSKCVPFQKVITIVRNPYETAISNYNRETTKSHIRVAKPKAFNSINWVSSCAELSDDWIKFIRSWTNSTIYSDIECDLLVLSYNELKVNLREQLVKIGRFLGVKEDFLHGDHMDCVINNSHGNAKRTQKQPYTDVFTASMNETIDKYIKEANDILKMISSDIRV